MRKWNKFFAILCALMLVLGSMSLGTFAEEGPTEQEFTQQEEAAQIAAEEEAARIAAEEAARKGAEEEAAKKAAEEEAARKAAEEEAARKAAEEEAAKQAEEAPLEQSEEEIAEPAEEEVPAEQPAEEVVEPVEVEAPEQTIEAETAEETVEVEAPAEPAEEDIPEQEAEEAEEKSEFEISDKALVKYNGESAEVTVPDGVEEIGEKAFAGNEKIEKVILPDSVEVIAESAFENCVNLKQIAKGNQSKLAKIEKNAFKGDKKLDTSFAEDVEEVSELAFEAVEKADAPAEAEVAEESAETAEEEIPVVEEIAVEEIPAIEEVSEEEIPAVEEITVEEEPAAFEEEITELTSRAATITSQPVSEEVALNEAASFTVVAENAKSYQWQFQREGQTTWNNCSSSTEGYNTATLKPVATELRYGFKYRCEVTGEDGTKAYTDAVMMIRALEIISQPESEAVALNAAAEFTVEATGVKSYQWQFQREGQTTWNNCSSSTEGYNTATLKPVATELRYTFTYRCELTRNDGEKIYTDSVKMLAPDPLSIISQPVSEEVALNEAASFTVVAENAKSYQWQFQREGQTTWNNCSSSTEGYNEATLKPVATEARYGFKYRCEVIGEDGTTAYTDAVMMICALVITGQPEDYEALMYQSASFAVVATGVKSYQWQFQREGEETWNNCSASTEGYNSAELMPVASTTRYTFTYRCELTRNDGEKYYTNGVRILIPDQFIEGRIQYIILKDEGVLASGLWPVSVDGFEDGFAGTASLTIAENPLPGYVVTEIGEEAFMDKTVLTSIDLPDTITIIRARAFKGCTNLREMK